MRPDLDPQLTDLITERIETGRYPDPGAVVREALPLLQERDRRREALHSALSLGFDQLDRGELIEWTPELMDELIRESEEMDRRGWRPHPDVCP